MEKVIIITGANGAIGSNIARLFLQQGDKVIANVHQNFEQIYKLKSEFGENLRIIQADIAKDDDIEKMFEIVAKEFKRVDILINNAAVFEANLLLLMTNEKIDQQLAVNLRGSITCSKKVVKFMVKQKEGLIVNISSIVGEDGCNGLSIYSATKAALTGFTKSLAKELGQYNIRVNNLTLGLVESEMSQKISVKEREFLIGRTPLRRMGTPREIAQVVLFLSESKFITGTTIRVDGGLSI